MKLTRSKQGYEANGPMVFDSSTGLYSGPSHRGFGYIIPPANQTEEFVQGALRHFFQMKHKPGSVMQVTTIHLSDVSAKLNAWESLPHDKSSVQAQLRKKRVEHMLTQNLKDVSVIISFSVPSDPKGAKEKEIEHLVETRNYLKEILDRAELKAETLTPTIHEAITGFYKNHISSITLKCQSPSFNAKKPGKLDVSKVSSDSVLTQTFVFGDREATGEKVRSKHWLSATLPLLSGLVGKTENWERLLKGLEEGEALLGLSTLLTLVGQGNEKDLLEAKSALAMAGYWFKEEKKHPSPQVTFLLPNGQYMKPTEYVLSSQASAMTNIAGDSKGNSVSGMLLKTRKNQIAFFDNFQSEGNYNIAVAASAGSGLSYQLNEFVMTHRAQGAQCFILDSHRNMKGLTGVLQGTYCDLNEQNAINPFTTIKPNEESDDISQRLWQIATFVIFLAELNHNDFYEPAHDAVLSVWQSQHNRATLQEVIVRLQNGGDKAQLIANRLADYAYKGRREKMFSQDATAFYDNSVVSFNLDSYQEDKKHFYAKLLSSILFISSALKNSDRQQRKICLFRDAWRFFEIPEQGAILIEEFYRGIRLYNAAAITTTLTLEDYFDYPLANSIFRNSYWGIVLQQRPGITTNSSIQKINWKNKNISDLETLHVAPKEYSEMAIFGGTLSEIFRLQLDPATQGLFAECT